MKTKNKVVLFSLLTLCFIAYYTLNPTSDYSLITNKTKDQKVDLKPEKSSVTKNQLPISETNK